MLTSRVNNEIPHVDENESCIKAEVDGSSLCFSPKRLSYMCNEHRFGVTLRT